jgi:hypothetical protein
MTTVTSPTQVPHPSTTAVQAISLPLLSTDDKNLLSAGTAGQQTPSQGVAGVAKQAATAAAGTVWQSQKTIVNQWTINQDRNSWIGVAGIGWQKLSTASDSGCVSLTMLAANALLSKASVNYRTESDGMVHEIYVF